MDIDINLYNAAEVGENPDTAFTVDGNHLHAVEKSVAHLEEKKIDANLVLSLMKDSLKALAEFAKGKIYEDTLRIDWDAIKNSRDQQLIIKHIVHIYSHLPHHDRNFLSSQIHHKHV